MNRRVSAILLTVGAILWVSCTKIDYIGDELAPTSHVDLYFSEADVTYDYRVMGHVVATADDFVSAEKMQKKIKEKALEKGADAVIILGMERYRSGESTNYSETTKQDGKNTVTTGSSSTSNQEKKEIRATFIKYKR